jgi:hypothetical protein
MWVWYAVWRSLVWDFVSMSVKEVREVEREENREEWSLWRSSMLGKRSVVDKGSLLLVLVVLDESEL